MIVVSDSSPLITLARIGQLQLLSRLYQTVIITPEIYTEVVVGGTGMAGSTELSSAKWIEVKTIKTAPVCPQQSGDLISALAILSVTFLSKEMNADLVSRQLKCPCG